MSIYIFSKEVAGSGTQKVITAYKTKQVKDIKTSGTYSNKYVNHLNEMLVKKNAKVSYHIIHIQRILNFVIHLH